MFDWEKEIVYCSKDPEDWKKAEGLLKDAGVPMKSWHCQEPSVAGCGAKIDIREFAAKRPVPKEIYKIEVAGKDRDRAAGILKGKVQPVRHYGVG